MDLRRTCQAALSVTQKDRGREHAGTSHMCRSSEPQLRIEESNRQTGDGPRSRNPGGPIPETGQQTPEQCTASWSGHRAGA